MSYSTPPGSLTGNTQQTFPNMPEEPSIRFRSRLFRLFKHNAVLLFLTCFIFWIPGVFYTVFVFKPSYISTASVLIKDSVTNSRYVTEEAPSQTSSPSSNPVFNTIELLKSATVKDSIWKNLLEKNPALQKELHLKDKKAWNAYFSENSQKLYRYKNPPGTDVVHIQTTWGKAETAEKALNVIVLAFKEASRELNRREFHERHEYLQAQVHQIENKLAVIRRQITQVKTRHNILDIDKQIEEYAKYHQEFKLATALADADLKSRSESFSTYQKTIGLSPREAMKAVALGRNPSFQKLNDNLYEKKEELSRLKIRYTDKNPKIIKLKASIQQIEKNITAEKRQSGLSSSKLGRVSDESTSKTIEDMVESYSLATGTKLKAQELHHQLNSMESRMSQLPTVAEQLKTLQDTEQYLYQALQTLQEKMVDAAIRDTQTLSNVFVITPPSLPDKPVRPTAKHLLLITLLSGPVAAVGLVLLKNTLFPPNNRRDHSSQSAFYTGKKGETATTTALQGKEPSSQTVI
jgi:uncharacterized protein involved in exopolysaccharide biosynthesis